MRPTRLELEGFASFRGPTELDLGGVDLFVLSGPTGSGKSSLIDAMVFALYGSVPRYDDRRLVAPAITQGVREARVRLTFEVDQHTYTATRVVRRTERGATTREARLERLRTRGEPEVLAGTADEVSEAVERLLGLTFEHFTSTVVLPQGEVAQFLHARPKHRQDLLVRLLDLDVYRRIGSAARDRATRARATVAALQQRLDTDLRGATPGAVATAAAQVTTLEGLAATVAEVRPALDRLAEAGRAARERATTAIARRDAVGAIRVPADLADTTGTIVAARERVTAAATAQAAAEAAWRAAEATRADLPERGAVEAIRGLVADLRSAEDERAAAAGAATVARSAVADARTAAAAADEELRAAAAELREVEHRHLAATLVDDLEPGRPCLVCGQEVTAVPERPVAPERDAAADRHARAAEAARRAASALRDADASLASATARRDAAERARSAVATRLAADLAALASAPAVDAAPAVAPEALRSPEAVAVVAGAVTAWTDRLATAVREAEAAVTRARRSHERATAAQRAAERAVADLRGALDGAWRAFDAARDTVAALGPPAPDREDLAGSWDALATWAVDRLPGLRHDATEAAATIDRIEADYRQLLGDVRSAVRDAGIDDPAGGLDVLERAVLGSLAHARHRHRTAADALAAATDVRGRLEAARDEATVATELGRHLDARRFEPWLLNRALRHLVRGATAILHDLTAGAYSLEVGDDGAFVVVDHRSADERRPARTLSGGETFLASLALALALADHVADLAAHGSARLDALFLDEGFGTLDAATLDTVAAAIEELGARGRMVGLVTHVRELAERVPVRFDVARTPQTSTVTRIDVDVPALEASA